jgi:pantetheine-phosphate adenylyltransferase
MSKILKKIAIYPGTFDPITLGHLDVVRSSLKICDELIVAVAEDITKKPLFNAKKRVELAKIDIKKYFPKANIRVESFKGLLMNYAAKNNVDMIVRGLRLVSDFEYEFQLASMNSKLNSQIQTVFIPASEQTQFIASNLVKEIARLGGNVGEFVSPNVSKVLKDTL